MKAIRRFYNVAQSVYLVIRTHRWDKIKDPRKREVAVMIRGVSRWAYNHCRYSWMPEIDIGPGFTAGEQGGE